MPPTLRKVLVYWVPIPVYVGLIFLASSFSRIPFRLPVVWLDKVIHFVEYALLAILVARAVRSLRWPRTWWAAWLVTIAAVLVCGALDELYQGTVANRQSDILDWTADGLGGAVGSLIYLLLAVRWRSRKASPPA
jgi:VanZ family protein